MMTNNLLAAKRKKHVQPALKKLWKYWESVSFHFSPFFRRKIPYKLMVNASVKPHRWKAKSAARSFGDCLVAPRLDGLWIFAAQNYGLAPQFIGAPLILRSCWLQNSGWNRHLAVP
jgi:hypothetical protein